MPDAVPPDSLLAPSPLRFALVGCGGIAPTQAQALKEIPQLARLTHCVDLVDERARLFAEKFGLQVATWDEVLAHPEVDAITVCTPSGHHGQLAAAALRAGKHVILEKPMEVSVAACDALLTAQREAGRQLAVISQHRFDPSAQTLRHLVNDRALGRLIAVEVAIPWYRTQEYYDSGDWRGTWALDGGGCLMNQGVHTLDLMLWLCGPVTEVYARTARAAHQRIEVEDLACATLTFANGALGTLVASTAMYPGFPARLGLFGTEGSALLQGDELQTIAIRGQETITGKDASAHALQVATGGTRSAVRHASAGATAHDPSAWKWGDAHRAQFMDFITAIHHQRSPLVDGVAGRAAVELIQAVYESARLGLPVRVGREQ